jgi:leucyl aminopeptidase
MFRNVAKKSNSYNNKADWLTTPRKQLIKRSRGNKMKFSISKEAPDKVKCDLLAIGCFEKSVEAGKKAPPAKLMREDGGEMLDRKLGGEISRMIKASSFTGTAGKMRMIYTEGRIPARHILLVGLGKKNDATLATLRSSAARIAKVADEIKAKSVALVIQPAKLLNEEPSKRLKVIAEGMEMGRYSFEVYKAKASRADKTLSRVFILSKKTDSALNRAIEIGVASASSALLARNLGNTPGNDMTPNILARFARDIAKKGKLTYKEMGIAQIKKEKMGALMAVAQGSAEPPVFIHIRYKPAGASRATVALVGKGITFDTGGISIKPSRGMEEMKGDMGGAAAVIGTMRAIAQLKPKVTVDAYIAAAENMPDGKAIKPGDIVTARNGKTIEFISTDAEGRMVLADGLTYASEKKPDYMIDVATLTGTCPYAVGEKYSAILGTDQKLIDKLKRAGDESGEPVWQLPLEKDYTKGLTMGPADLRNLGSSKADTIIAALFLQNFIGEIPWAHLDIASTAWSNEVTELSPKGATGVGVRLLTQFLLNL